MDILRSAMGWLVATKRRMEKHIYNKNFNLTNEIVLLSVLTNYINVINSCTIPTFIIFECFCFNYILL